MKTQAITLLALTAVLPSAVSAPTDPPPSWTDTAAKQAIVALAMATRSGMRTGEFEKSDTDWIITAKHSKAGKPFTSIAYQSIPGQVAGSSGGLKYEVREGTPAILKIPELVLNDDKEGKPAGIQRHIDRRPIDAFGNFDGDFHKAGKPKCNIQWSDCLTASTAHDSGLPGIETRETPPSHPAAGSPFHLPSRKLP